MYADMLGTSYTPAYLSTVGVSARDLYLQAHGVSAAVSEAIDLVVKENAADPIARIAVLLGSAGQLALESRVRVQDLKIRELEAEHERLREALFRSESALARTSSELAEAKALGDREAHAEQVERYELRVSALAEQVSKLTSENNSLYLENMSMAQEEERQEVVLEQLCGAWCRSGGNEAALLRRVFGAWAGDRGGRRTKRVGLLSGLGMRRSSR